MNLGRSADQNEVKRQSRDLYWHSPISHGIEVIIRSLLSLIGKKLTSTSIHYLSTIEGGAEVASLNCIQKDFFYRNRMKY